MSSRRPKGKAVTVATRKHKAKEMSNFILTKTRALIFLERFLRDSTGSKGGYVGKDTKNGE